MRYVQWSIMLCVATIIGMIGIAPLVESDAHPLVHGRERCRYDRSSRTAECGATTSLVRSLHQAYGHGHCLCMCGS
jgi:hypothetical protein